MNQIITRKYEMLERLDRFEDDYPINPPNARATVLFTAVNAVVMEIRAALLNQQQGRSQRRGGVNVRNEIARSLREMLKGIGRTARTLNRAAHPGIAEQFRLPKSRGYPALFAAAQTAIAVATPIKAAFVELAMPEDFLDDLEDLTEAFGLATGQKNDGFFTQVGGTAALFVRASDGVKAARELDTIVRNHFRNDPTTLAIWTTARRIERAPRSAEPAPAPATAPGPVPGSGS
jgi:hypothetical protein